MSDARVIPYESSSPTPQSTASEGPHPFAVRVWSAFVLLLCAGMLSVGLWLTPDPRGTETHTQLKLAPCSWLSMWGVPCPTCGCTTAVSHFSHGHWRQSLITQPFGFAVALLALILLPLTAAGVATGKWYGPSMWTLSWYWRRWFWSGMAIFAIGWAWKALAVWKGWH